MRLNTKGQYDSEKITSITNGLLQLPQKTREEILQQSQEKNDALVAYIRQSIEEQIKQEIPLDDMIDQLSTTTYNSEEQIRFAQALADSGDLERIMTAWRKVPENSEAERILEQGMIAPAQALADSGDLERTMVALEKVPANSEAGGILAQALADSGDLERIMVALEKVPANSEAERILARAKITLGVTNQIQELM